MELYIILLYILIFCVGLLFGSFLNLVSDRSVNGEPILVGRSHCGACKKPLSPIDLVPLLSFMFNKGKCRYCKDKLSYIYPLSEFVTGLVFVILAYFSKVLEINNLNVLLSFLYLMGVACFYIILFLTDIKYRLIPNKVVLSAIGFVFVGMLVLLVVRYGGMYINLCNDSFGKYLLKTDFLQSQVLNSLKSIGFTLISTIGIASFFIFLIWVTKGKGMGGGDVTLGILIGLFNGFPNNIIAIFLGFVFGSLVSLLLILVRKKTLKDTVPFGPFLILGSVVAYFWGAQLLNTYFNLFP